MNENEKNYISGWKNKLNTSRIGIGFVNIIIVSTWLDGLLYMIRNVPPTQADKTGHASKNDDVRPGVFIIERKTRKQSGNGNEINKSMSFR